MDTEESTYTQLRACTKSVLRHGYDSELDLTEFDKLCERQAPSSPTCVTYIDICEHFISNTSSSSECSSRRTSPLFFLPDRTTGTLLVEKDLVGLLVGPHGATILSMKSKVNELYPNVVPADIITPKMGAEACFTITGTPEQIKLVKEIMCLYIVGRDPNRQWPDVTVLPSSEAQYLVSTIIEEQKLREMNIPGYVFVPLSPITPALTQVPGLHFDFL